MLRITRTLSLVLFFGLVLNLGFIQEGTAADCGGSLPCRCGDTVQGAAILTADLGICPGTGLQLVSGSRLDCDGHIITGSNLSAAKYGILLDEAVGARVSNCHVTGFRRNLRIVGGKANTVKDSEFFGGRYGMDLADATTHNDIIGNYIHGNRDEGIHVGTGADDTTISDNVFDANKLEHVYLLNVNRCKVTNNTFGKNRAAAIFVKHSGDNTISGNTVVDAQIQVRGGSVDNVFESNQLLGKTTNGYIFEAYLEPTGWTYPHDNSVRGGLIQRAKVCARFLGSYDNLIDRLQVKRCDIPFQLLSLGGRASTGNVINLVPAP
jgi:parallel beta-helix repeat protein